MVIGYQILEPTWQFKCAGLNYRKKKILQMFYFLEKYKINKAVEIYK